MMATRKKQRLTIHDLSRVPLTPVPNTSGYEDGKTLFARLQREEREAQEKAARAAFLKTPEGQLETQLKATSAALPEINRQVKTFYSQPDGERLLNVFVLEHPRDFGLGNDFPQETRVLTDYQYRTEIAP